MPVQTAFQEETNKLDAVLAEIERHLEGIGPKYYGEDFTEQMLDLVREERKQRLHAAVKEPYFGRLDYQEEGGPAVRPIYIGKSGIENEQSNEPLVIDWRAPISSLFYSFTGGEDVASYESPDGNVRGWIHLKRNLVVRDRRLQRAVDSYVKGGQNVSAVDEFLLYRLAESKDHRLRDIVSTIQMGQDRIIRSTKNKALIIQGVAGSGKTTVALHRLAFLLYQYKDFVRSDRMIIFAPNRMFLDYISGVLPELGVGDIKQTTFAEWALEQLDEEVKLSDPSETFNDWFRVGRQPWEDEEAPGKWKGSLRFKHLIDMALERLKTLIIPNDSFIPWDEAALPAETIRGWFDRDYASYPLMKRRERVLNRIKRWMDTEAGRHIGLRRKEKARATTKWRNYAKRMPQWTALRFYESLFEPGGTSALSPFRVDMIPRQIAKQTLRRLNDNEVDPEDLAPLVYIHHALYGGDGRMFDHIVLDEAQDYSPFQISLLCELQRETSMTILGDIQQGIHTYTGIESWDEFLSMFGGDQASYFELDLSYRSTSEIVEFANVVLTHVSDRPMLAKPVFRSGDEVEIVSHEKEKRRVVIEKTVRDWLKQDSFHTIAVIGRTERDCERIYRELRKADIDCTLIVSKQQAYQGGLSVVPAYLVKGLEFDAVLIVDADQVHYGEQDAKLLYVACTRALHRLKLAYSGELSPLVQPQVT